MHDDRSNIKTSENAENGSGMVFEQTSRRNANVNDGFKEMNMAALDIHPPMRDDSLVSPKKCGEVDLEGSELPIYQHQPLLKDFRLLSLHPGTDKDEVVISLVEVSFDEEREYEGLSYAWGSLDLPRSISHGDSSFNITDNLFHALKRLRYINRPRTLWVDALCIS